MTLRQIFDSTPREIDAEALEEHLLLAALDWWKSKRPEGWTHRQHLHMPDAFLRSAAEQELAQRVAAYLIETGETK